MGEVAVRSHAEGKKHKSAFQRKRTLDHITPFCNPSCSSKTESETSDGKRDEQVALSFSKNAEQPSQVTGTPTMDTFLVRKEVKKAEI